MNLKMCVTYYDPETRSKGEFTNRHNAIQCVHKKQPDGSDTYSCCTTQPIKPPAKKGDKCKNDGVRLIG